MLLAHGMSPDQMNWQHQTLLHLASTSDSTECAAILLDAGATIIARDDDYRSTPLAWARPGQSAGRRAVVDAARLGGPAWAPADRLDSSGSWSDKMEGCLRLAVLGRWESRSWIPIEAMGDCRANRDQDCSCVVAHCSSEDGRLRA